MEKSNICKGCWAQKRMPIFIRGPMSIPTRLMGLKISKMNPNICTMCENNFYKIKKSKNVVIPATILFADVRGYTVLSQEMSSPEMTRLLGSFYEACGSAVWEHDGIVNKLIGDAVLAVFNFPITQINHVQQAVLPLATTIWRRKLI